METHFTRRIGPLISPGRQARLILPPEEPKPPTFVRTINIVVKILNQANFPVQSRYLREMIGDLNRLNLLNEFIGRNKSVVMRVFSGQATRLNPPANVWDVVHKEGYIYCLVLQNDQRLILRHLQGRWFRAVAFFNDHLSYIDFLDVYFNNNTTF